MRKDSLITFRLVCSIQSRVCPQCTSNVNILNCYCTIHIFMLTMDWVEQLSTLRLLILVHNCSTHSGKKIIFQKLIRFLLTDPSRESVLKKMSDIRLWLRKLLLVNKNFAYRINQIFFSAITWLIIVFWMFLAFTRCNPVFSVTTLWSVLKMSDWEHS